jgi:uncharacterized protein YjbI with pentapeptide repeats
MQITPRPASLTTPTQANAIPQPPKTPQHPTRFGGIPFLPPDAFNWVADGFKQVRPYIINDKTVPTIAAATTAALIKQKIDNDKARKDAQKPAALQAKAIAEHDKTQEAYQTLLAASRYFNLTKHQPAKPLERDMWAERVVNAIYWLYNYRKLSGDWSSYALSDKDLSLPGIPLKNLVLEAEKPKDAWKIDAKFWLSKAEKRAKHIANDAKLTDQRVDAHTDEDRRKYEAENPARNRANLSGLAIPHAKIDQVTIKGGRLHRANLHAVVARGLRLIGGAARQLNLSHAKLAMSEIADMNLPGAQLNNTEAFGLTINNNNFAPNAKRNIPAANMDGFTVVNQQHSVARGKTIAATSQLKQNNFTQVPMQQADFGQQTDLTGSVFNQANVTGARFVAPNLTSTQWNHTIGFKTTEMQAMRNKQVFKPAKLLGVTKKSGVLRLLQQACRAEVNPAWRNKVQTPLANWELNQKKAHMYKPVIMQKADIRHLNFANKDIAQFDFTKAQAAKTDYSQSTVGKIPMVRYIAKFDQLAATGKDLKTLRWLRQQLPMFKTQDSAPILSNNATIHRRLVKKLLSPEVN